MLFCFFKVEWTSLLTGAYSKRKFLSSVVFADRLYIFGGESASGLQNDVFCYDLSSWSSEFNDVWSSRKQMDVIVSPLTDGASSPGTSLILIGGQADQGELRNDIWVYKDVVAPSEPLHLNATALQHVNTSQPSNSIQVRWSPSVFDGGAPIIRYIVSDPYGGSTTETNQTSVVIEGLSYDTNYTFIARAVNIAGTSPPSLESNVQGTARAGYYVNSGGPIPIIQIAPPTDTFRSSTAIEHQTWFIALIVLIAVAAFVIICFIVIRRHTRKANAELGRLDEIEAWDDTGHILQDGIQLDLTELGLEGPKLDKQEELAKWRRGELTELRVTSSKRATGGHLAPLGFMMGGEEEQDAIERLGKELSRLNRQELNQDEEAPALISPRLYGDELYSDSRSPSRHTISPTPMSPPSDLNLHALCSSAADSLTADFAAEYRRQIQRDPTSTRMMPYDEVHAVLEHAFYASGVFRHLHTSMPQHVQQREHLHRILFDALLPEVSVDAREIHALRGALAKGEASHEDHVFVLARARMLRWMFETVKEKRDKLAEREVKNMRRFSLPTLEMQPNTENEADMLRL